MGACPNVLSKLLLCDVTPRFPSMVGGLAAPDHFGGESVARVAAAHQLASTFKKFEDTSLVADAEAVRKFLEVNESISRMTIAPERMIDEELLGEFANSIHRSIAEMLDHISFEDLFHLGRCGPGASRLSPSSDLFTKLFDGKLSTTSELLTVFYKRSCSYDHRWNSAELFRQSKFGEPVVVNGSRLSCVPKNREVSRTICTEPTLNMFYQLGMGEVINGLLNRRFGINLSNQQSVNQKLARAGSLEGQYCTIDLSSASDSISLVLCRQFFQKSFLDRLMQLRSPTTIVGNKEVQLHMISSMGNGFTFSLMTLIFCCVVEAAYRFEGIPLKRGFASSSFDGVNLYKLESLPNYAVFGDDIICRKETFPRITRLLKLLGFQVNTSKTFSEGPFRESCGHDYYHGENVRPVFIRRLTTVQDHCSAYNRLSVWSARWNIPLTNTLSYLLKYCGKQYVPRWESDDAGVKVPLSCLSKKRYSKATRTLIYYRWRARPRYLRFGNSTAAPSEGDPRLELFSSSGLGLAFLYGSLRSNRIMTASRSTLFDLQRSMAPNWDAILARDLLLLDVHGWQRWEALSARYLTSPS